VLTGRGADIILIDDPLKPEEALSDVRRQGTNEWYDNTLYSRLNDKRYGGIIVIMQRLHEDDLVGHVVAQEGWVVVSFPAIAEADEVHQIETIWGPQCFTRRRGEALHPEREPLDTLEHIRRTLGEYNFAGQYRSGQYGIDDAELVRRDAQKGLETRHPLIEKLPAMDKDQVFRFRATDLLFEAAGKCRGFQPSDSGTALGRVPTHDEPIQQGKSAEPREGWADL
jgi:hypothetical protein